MLENNIAQLDTQLRVVLEKEPTNPRVIKFQQEALPEITSRAASLKGFSPLGEDETNSLFETLSAEAVKPGFLRVLGRLKRETDYLGELEEVGIDRWLEGKKARFSQPFISFFDKGGLVNTIVNKARSGQAEVGGKTWPLPFCTWLNVYGENPTPLDSWKQMVQNGRLPESIEVLYHEHIHALQLAPDLKSNLFYFTQFAGTFSLLSFSENGLQNGYLYLAGMTIARAYLTNWFINGSFSGVEYNSILWETQAYGATDNAAPTTSEYSGGYISAVDFDDFLETNASEVASYINEQMLTLRAFGVPEREIAQLSRKHARFNRKTERFPKLDELVEREKVRWGIEDEDIFAALKELLIEKRKVEIKISQLQAQKIATEELQVVSIP